MESVGEAFESARLRLIEAMVAWMKRETSSVQTLETLAPLLNAEVVGLEMFGLVKACCAWVTYVTVKSSERTTDYPSDALRTILAPLWHYHRFVKEVFPLEWKGGSPRSELDQDEEELDMHAAEEEEESSMSSLPHASLGDSTLSTPIIVSGSAMDLDCVKKDAVPTARLYHGPNLGWSVVRISMCHSDELHSSYLRPAEKTEEERSSVTVPMEMTSMETTATTTTTVANVFPTSSTNAKTIATSATANSAPLGSAGLGLSVSMRGKPSLASSTLSNLLSSSSSSSSLSSSSSSSSLSSSSSSSSSASLQTASSTNTVDPPTLADLSETWRLVKSLVEPILIDRGLVLWLEKRAGFALVAGGAGEGEAPEVSAQYLAAMYGLVLPPGFASLYEATKLFKDHIIMDADFIKDNVETIVAELAKICEKELETICEAEHIAEDPLHVGAFGGSSRLSARKKDGGLDSAPRSGEDGILNYTEEEHAAETHTVPRILLSLYACVLFLAIDLAALPHSDTASYKGECLRKRLLLKDGPHSALRLWFMPPAAQSHGADGSDLASLETVDPVWLWRSLKRFGKRLLGNDPSAALVLFHVDHRLMSTLGYRCYQEAEADGYAEDEEENVELDESSHGLSYDGEELCEDSYNNEDYETYHHDEEFEEVPEVYDYEAEEEEAVVEEEGDQEKEEKEEPDYRAPLLGGGNPTNAQLMESIASLTAKVSQLLEPQAEVERCQEEASSEPSVAQVLDAVAQVNTQVATLADSLTALNNRVIVYEGVFQQWAQLIKCRQADAASGNPADEKQF